MNNKYLAKWVSMFCVVAGMTSCGPELPKEVPSSFETMTVEKSDIKLPYKFSARMVGQNDVTITPQVSGQLMKICVTESQLVKKGQTLFRLTCKRHRLRRTAQSWSTSRTRTFSTSR